MTGIVFDKLRAVFSIRESHLRELRGRWGRKIERHRDRADIAELHRLTRDTRERRHVDDFTWDDLDMDAVFDAVDGTTTPIGRQLLYRQMKTYEPDTAELEARYALARAFVDDPDLRETVQLNVWRLRSANASSLTTMLFGTLPSGDFPTSVARTLAIVSSSTLAFAVLVPSFFWLPALPILANFLFAERYADEIGRHSLSFVYLRSLLTTARRLTALHGTGNIAPLSELREQRGTIRRLRRRFLIVGLDSTSGNLLVAQITYLLNLICLFDFLVFMRCSRRLAEHRETLIDLYLAVARLDSAIAVGSYLVANERHCNPRFGPDGHVDFRAMSHPLLTDAVPNDYATDGRSALITGSNMAGKSTFIKAIGVNLILARTLWLCHARSAVLPMTEVMSSIKRADSLDEGKSYYFAEIEAVLRLIGASEGARRHVFLIDEIFNGTNTVERIASAAAVLGYLSRDDIVMVTSHDVELETLLPARYTSYHFRESADVERLFDYTLRAGHVTTRNAIALLEAIGFPESVVTDARSIASSRAGVLPYVP